MNCFLLYQQAAVISTRDLEDAWGSIQYFRPGETAGGGRAVGTDYGSTAGSQGAASMGDTDSCFQISAFFPFLPSQNSTMEMKCLPIQQEVPGWGGEDIRHRGPKVLLFFFGSFYQLFPHSPQLHANIKNKHQQFCPVLLCFYIYIYINFFFNRH